MSDRVAVRVRGLMLDERTKAPIVLLQEEGGDRVLPIWIGEPEARAIGSALTEERPPRPMTHDLILDVIHGMRGEILAVTVTALRDSTFFAEIVIEAGGEQVILDARPSDSIAVALRAGAPLYVARELLEGGEIRLPGRPSEPSAEEKAAQLRKFLEELDPGDFGKFGI